jgi:hypothetical protein
MERVNNSDNAHDMMVDIQGNIYLAGYAVQRGNNRDFFTIKLNSSGDTAWTRFLNGTSPDSEDEGQAVSIDDQGNVLVSGFTKNSGTSGDYTSVKFNSGVIHYGYAILIRQLMKMIKFMICSQMH